MKYFYMFGIAVSVFFNSFVQSYAYAAWRDGVPLTIAVTCDNMQEAAFTMSLEQLTEVEV